MMKFLNFDQKAREATFGESTAHAWSMKRRINSFHSAASSALTVNDLWAAAEYESYAREGLISHYIFVLTEINCAEYNYEQFIAPNAVRPSMLEKANFTKALTQFFGIARADIQAQEPLCRWMHVLQQSLKNIAEIDSVKQAGIGFHQAKQRCEFYDIKARNQDETDETREEMFKYALDQDRIAEYHQAKLWYLIQSYVHAVKETVIRNQYSLINAEDDLANLVFADPSPHWKMIEPLLPSIVIASSLGDESSSVELDEDESKQPETVFSKQQQTSSDNSSTVTVQDIKQTYKGYGGGLFAAHSLFNRPNNTPDKIFAAMEQRCANKSEEGASAKTLAHYGKK